MNRSVPLEREKSASVLSKKKAGSEEIAGHSEQIGGGQSDGTGGDFRIPMNKTKL